MRWFWIVIGMLLALAVGIIIFPNCIKVKYGPTALSNCVKEYRCEPAGLAQPGDTFRFTVHAVSYHSLNNIEVRVEGEYKPIALHDDGKTPDSAAGDATWTGDTIIHGEAGARSVCVVVHRGKEELIWLAPPLEVKP